MTAPVGGGRECHGVLTRGAVVSVPSPPPPLPSPCGWLACYPCSTPPLLTLSSPSYPSAPQLFASVTALPACSARVCCFKNAVKDDSYRLKTTKLCTLDPVPPALAPAPVVATCLFGAYQVDGFGPCPGAPAGPPPQPPVTADPCFTACAGNTPRTVCDLFGFPSTCDIVTRLFGVRPPVTRMAAAVGGGAPTWADVAALLQGA